MFGAYQAGAWRALETAFRPAAVVGASVGALNGWAIAGGASGRQLVEQWLDPATGAILKMQVPCPPWRGLFCAESLAEAVRLLFSSYNPQIPFAGTAVDLLRLREVLFRGEEMTWRHLLAMCSILGGSAPVKLQARWYVDGGLLSVLPLWAAAELGYSHVIAVNALPEMPSRTVRAAVGTIRWFSRRADRIIPLHVWMVSPGQALGSVRDSVIWSTENARRWIERGQRDAESLLRTFERSALPEAFV